MNANWEWCSRLVNVNIPFSETVTAYSTEISPNFLVWKFCGNAQCSMFNGNRPKLFGNCVFPQSFHARKLGKYLVFYVVRRCSLKYVSWKFLQNSQGNTCARDSLIKYRFYQELYWKETLTQIFAIFFRTLFQAPPKNSCICSFIWFLKSNLKNLLRFKALISINSIHVHDMLKECVA